MVEHTPVKRAVEGSSPSLPANSWYRRYTDTQGKQRLLQFVRHVDGYVNWMIGQGFSKAEIWRMEDGSVIQIPRDAWPVLGIKYVDFKRPEGDGLPL